MSDHLDAAIKSISDQRLAPYLARVDGDRRAALEHYIWNAQLSGQLLVVFHHLEVSLRNAIAAQLHDLRVRAGHPDGAWFWVENVDPWFEPWWTNEMRRVLSKTIRSARRDDRLVNEGRVIGETSFGFWRFVLTSRYESSLWTPAVRHAFHPGLARADVYEIVEQLNELRNRIAHHEPIVSRDLEEDVSKVEALSDHLAADTTLVLEATEHLRQLIDSGPSTTFSSRRPFQALSDLFNRLPWLGH